MTHKILAIEDDIPMLNLIRNFLKDEDYEILGASTVQEGLDLLRQVCPSLILLDLHLPDRPGRDILDFCGKNNFEIPIIVMSAQHEVSEVVSCMQSGAVDYLHKPIDRTRLITSIRNCVDRKTLEQRLDRATEQLRRGETFEDMIGHDGSLAPTVALLRKASQSDVGVLIQGESGTGKELAARALHAASSRRKGPFIAVNCGAIPENLAESELFGHEKGAFTGAIQKRVGQFEQADGGTIFLDEIGELRLDLQVKLLRVLQERVVTRVGGTQLIPVDIRVLAATNRDLAHESLEGRFREDLYYRLAVFPVELPPTRERTEDLDEFLKEFVTKFSNRHRKNISSISGRAGQALRSYPWPGNVREMMNVIERAVIIEESDSITLDSLPDTIVCQYIESSDDILTEIEIPPYEPEENCAPQQEDTPGDIEGEDHLVIRTLAEEEKRIVSRALDLCDWNIELASQKLGIGRATIYRKIDKYELKKTTEPNSIT